MPKSFELKPDSRWTAKVGDCDSLAEVASGWPVHASTPVAIAHMLRVSRELFVHGYFVYDFLMVAAVQSLLAVEAALRDVLKEPPRRRGPTFHPLVERAAALGYLTTEAAEKAKAGAQLRNRWVHVEGQKVIPPGMAAEILGTSHQLVADMYDAC
ncbi:MAG: hypothetical protein M3N28_04705 [Actinomycetota bacterium]|nr:hypothetical protein [Actinomycetota bacterium]